MKSTEIYKRFLLKINKNDSNDGINILPAHFVLMFNSEALKWLNDKLDKDADNIKLDHLDKLLEADVEVEIFKEYDDSVEFNLPENFHRHASSFSIADKGECKGVKIFNFEKKSLGFTATLADDFSKPQFDYEETVFLISKNRIKVYTDDFKIRKVFVTYYKTPIAIDMAGYTRIDGTPSENIDSELSLENIDEILDRMATESNRQFENAEGFQFSKERENENG
jgi:hypothetical protein